MKKILLIIFVLSISFMVIGCSNVTSSSTTTTTTTTSMTTTTSTTTEPNEISFTGVVYVDGVFTWDLIPNVTYDVYVNNALYRENITSFDTSVLASEMIYKIQIHASLGTLVSDSNVYYINKIESAPVAEVLTVDLSLNRDEIVFSSDTEASLVLTFNFDSVPYSYTDGNYVFPGSYLSSLGYGDHVFYFVFDSEVKALLLTISDTRSPYLIGSNQISVNPGSDVVVEFGLYNGAFVALSGNDITTDDYSITTGVLTIDGTYIQNKFVNEPGRTTLILSYTLQSGDNIIIGYLFITLNQAE